MSKLASSTGSLTPQTSPAKSVGSRSEFEITSSNVPQAIVLWDPNSLRSSPTLNELLASESVVLAVGPEQTRTTIHRILFRGLSEPLHQLLTSHSYGQVSNINETLKLDDADAFLQLVRIAYKIASSEKEAVRNRFDLNQLTHSEAVSQTSIRDLLYAGEIKTPKCTSCKKGYLHPMLVCGSCNRICGANSNSSLNGLKDFLHAMFNQNANSNSKHAPVVDIALDLKAHNGQSHSLLHFAKVFSLASKYSVPDLAVTSFRAFERRLKRFAKQDIDIRDDDEVYDVLRYFAAGTVVDVDAENPLRRCLMRFVASKLDEFMGDEEFKEIMVANGILGLELAQVMAEAILAAAEAQ